MPDEKFELADAGTPADVVAPEAIPVDPNVKKLKYPITFQGQTITEVRTRRLKGKDMVLADTEARAIAGEEPGAMLLGLVSLARKTGLAYEVVAEMDMDDINALSGDDSVPLQG